MLNSPGEAERVGGRIIPPAEWRTRREALKLDLLRQKFAHPEFAELLQATGATPPVEINTWGHTYWGICNILGENRPGRLLEQVRTEHEGRRLR